VSASARGSKTEEDGKEVSRLIRPSLLTLLTLFTLLTLLCPTMTAHTVDTADPADPADTTTTSSNTKLTYANKPTPTLKVMGAAVELSPMALLARRVSAQSRKDVLLRASEEGEDDAEVVARILAGAQVTQEREKERE
jgi:hypothetical protein